MVRHLLAVAATVIAASSAIAAPDTALVGQLKHNDGRGTEALEKLIARGRPAVPALIAHARDGGDLASRGRAIVALSRIGGLDVDKALSELKGPPLLMSWTAAARIRMAPSLEDLLELSPLLGRHPELQRPFGQRATAMLADEDDLPVARALDLARRHPPLQSALAPRILAGGAGPLVKVMTTSGDDALRRQAAAYLATLAGGKEADAVAVATVQAFAFDAAAKAVPWTGGALFLPSISWDRAEARTLVGHLVAWHLWCDLRDKANLQKQIHNNIRSLGLARAAGYSSPGWSDAGTVRWLQVWKGVVGREGIEAILKAQNATAPKYQAVLDGN